MKKMLKELPATIKECLEQISSNGEGLIFLVRNSILQGSLTSKQYNKPGEALANLDCAQAEAFAYACQQIKAGTIQLAYNPKTNNTHMKEDSNV